LTLGSKVGYSDVIRRLPQYLKWATNSSFPIHHYLTLLNDAVEKVSLKIKWWTEHTDNTK
jgi:hypothetical protein